MSDRVQTERAKCYYMFDEKFVDVRILPSTIQHDHTRCQNGKIIVNQTVLFSFEFFCCRETTEYMKSITPARGHWSLRAYGTCNLYFLYEFLSVNFIIFLPRT